MQQSSNAAEQPPACRRQLPLLPQWRMYVCAGYTPWAGDMRSLRLRMPVFQLQLQVQTGSRKFLPGPQDLRHGLASRLNFTFFCFERIVLSIQNKTCVLPSTAGPGRCPAPRPGDCQTALLFVMHESICKRELESLLTLCTRRPWTLCCATAWPTAPTASQWVSGLPSCAFQ